MTAGAGGAPTAADKGLDRGMKVFGALVLTLSAATPASSVFVIVPDVLSEAGTGALLAMGIAAAIAVCIAAVYAELGSAFPMAGGEYAITARTLGPMAGFVVLGLNLSNSLFATAVLALGAGQYFAAALGVPALPAALACVVAATGLGVLNIRANAWVTGLFVGVELLALGVLATLGLLHPERSLTGVLAHPMALGPHGLLPTAPAAIGLAVAVALFAYDGYGSAIYFSEEIHGARRRVWRAILWALVVTVGAEVIPLAAVVTGAPDLKALIDGGGFGDFVARRGGAGLARTMNLAVALAILNAVIAMVLLVGRQLYSTGRDGTWAAPVNAVLSNVSRRFRSPWGAGLVAGGLATALCLVDLKLLLIATGTGCAFIYASLCLALLKRGRREAADGGYQAPLHPLAPVAALIALAGVVVSDALDPAEGRPGLIVVIAIALAAAGYYAAVVRRRGGWTLVDPAPEAARAP